MTKRERLIEIIDRINDGDDITDILTLFRSMDNLINIITKEGLLMMLNPHGANFDEDYQGQVLLAMLDNDTTGDVFELIVNESFNDILEENGNYYYKGSYNNNDLTELKELFDSSSESIADAILSNEYYEMFSIDSFDAFVDVVDNLNIANQERLKQYILENHRGFEFDDGTILGDDNVIDAINDQSYFDEIYSMDDNLEQELYNLYSQAYNHARESEQQKYVFEALTEYFEMDNLWVEDGKGGWNLKIRIPNFEQIVRDYLQESTDGYPFNPIDYYGSFLSILNVLMENNSEYKSLSFHIVEYPGNVREHINELFGDYI
jgi:hypothetical protein